MMNWEKAKNYLYEIKREYENIGFAGVFGLSVTINPLVKRFEDGERTQELYDEITGLN